MQTVYSCLPKKRNMVKRLFMFTIEKSLKCGKLFMFAQRKGLKMAKSLLFIFAQKELVMAKHLFHVHTKKYFSRKEFKNGKLFLQLYPKKILQNFMFTQRKRFKSGNMLIHVFVKKENCKTFIHVYQRGKLTCGKLFIYVCPKERFKNGKIFIRFCPKRISLNMPKHLLMFIKNTMLI